MVVFLTLYSFFARFTRMKKDARATAPITLLPLLGSTTSSVRAQWSKSEFDPGSEGTPARCLTHASRTLFSGSWSEGKGAPIPREIVSPSFKREVRGRPPGALFGLCLLGIVENKVANGCVRRGNLPNSSGQILKKADKALFDEPT